MKFGHEETENWSLENGQKIKKMCIAQLKINVNGELSFSELNQRI